MVRMKAFYIKTNAIPALFLGNDDAIFIFMTKELAEKYVEVSDAEPQETFRIVEIQVEEVV